ncbi:EAL domain-containing protein [Denitromonas iodatirespirans]|uniref:EAL domain-containing protein n=1 Tax=Denitromonas iodatirespirans TaxID=2795389 RepID=A0A944D792_DENI1|nr:EAL domain-containing protein [Denitromonas iodatirespirans]MBT0961244.1 EAL domain-containing protein [Denitromonas iodatirespirans]
MTGVRPSPVRSSIPAQRVAAPPLQPESATRAERWLPRLMLGAMLALVLVLLVSMGSYYIYRHEQAFESRAADIEKHAFARLEQSLHEEVAYLGKSLKEHRESFDTRLAARLDYHSRLALDAAERTYRNLRTTASDAQARKMVLEVLRTMGQPDAGLVPFIVDADGRVRLFALDPSQEGHSLATVIDDTGLPLIDRLVDVATLGDGHLRLRWRPQSGDGSMTDLQAHVGRFAPFGWIVGVGIDQAQAQATAREQALGILSRHSPPDDRVILVVNQHGQILAGGLPALGDQLPEWIGEIARTGRRGGQVLRIDMRQAPSQPIAPHLVHVAGQDEWGWTLAAIARLDDVDQVIAAERERMEASKREDFTVTLFAMLTATALALLLSMVFYRWINQRFQRYQQDIGARNQALKESARELRLSAQVFDASNEAIAILDHRFRIVSVNPALARISGFHQADIVGRHCAELLIGEHADGEVWRRTASRLRSARHWSGEIELQRADGSHYPGWISLGAITNDTGRITHFVVSISDISERKRTEQRLRHMAEYDALTGLPNRILLLDRMGSAIENARRNDGHLAVLFIDLDRFKNINDSLGHAAGDGLLRQVAGRLSAVVRSCDTVSRLGGDEFVVLLIDLDSAARAATVAGKILKALATPYEVNGHELSITPSIGITVFPEDGDNRELLLKNADAAMYHAKENGRNSYQFFTDELNNRAHTRLALENELRRALTRREFSLHFQPQFDLAHRRLIGAEALLRWNHPERGMIPPDQFIPIAEETGLIIPLGAWILHESCRIAQGWRDEGLPDLCIAVNISALQVRRGQLDSTVVEALGESGLPARLLELEVTESALMTHQAHVSATLDAIHALGVKLAIDDFGTGYSSLAYLKRFKLDKLKIDRSFIRDLPDDAEDAHLTRAIVGIAHHLGMTAVAEGVETKAQEAFLSELGCDLAQGYLYARPLPADAFRQMQIDLGLQAASKPAASTA